VNHYGQLALDHSRRHRPSAYAAISDPATHFSEVGEEVQAAVTELRDRLLGPTHPNESPHHYQQRGFQALRTAEERVMSDLVWLPPEPEAEAEPDPVLEGYYRGLEEFARAMDEARYDWTAEDPELSA
jgi:hypothetical protein